MFNVIIVLQTAHDTTLHVTIEENPDSSACNRSHAETPWVFLKTTLLIFVQSAPCHKLLIGVQNTTDSKSYVRIILITYNPWRAIVHGGRGRRSLPLPLCVIRYRMAPNFRGIKKLLQPPPKKITTMNHHYGQTHPLIPSSWSVERIGLAS